MFVHKIYTSNSHLFPEKTSSFLILFESWRHVVRRSSSFVLRERVDFVLRTWSGSWSSRTCFVTCTYFGYLDFPWNAPVFQKCWSDRPDKVEYRPSCLGFFSKTAEISTGFLSSRGERVSSARYDEYQNTVKFQSNQTGRFSAIQCCLCTSQGLDDFLMRSTSIQP